MPTNNQTIMEKVYLAGTNDFQQRVPNPTQNSIASVSKFLFDPMNRNYFNQFMDILINRIAFTYVRGEAWKNKLAVFKGQKITYGSTIQEVAFEWIKAHSYTYDAETLLKVNKPEGEVIYHSQNRQEKYPISIAYDALRTAFVDEYGINNFIAKAMQVPMNSDEYDEYRIMLQLMAFYEENWGFYKHQLSAVPTDEDTGKEFLTALQTYAGMLEFPSTLYNAMNINNIPVFVKSSELVLFVTPAVNASVNVNTLSILFNMDVADVKIRKILVDELPIQGAVALLTTEDFFVCHDTLYENTSFWNPETLATNYWLHHWGIYSVSGFVPAILFTTATGTSVNSITESVSGISVAFNENSVNMGGTAQLTINLEGTITANNSGIVVAPNSAIFEVSCVDANGDTKKLAATTYVDKYGILHVQKRGLVDDDVITVTATATYINPSADSTSTYTDTASIVVDTNNELPSVKLNKTAVTLDLSESETETLTATVKPTGTTVTWKSSDKTKATVSNGVVTPVATGTANITAEITVGGVTYKDTCVVTVVA